MTRSADEQSITRSGKDAVRDGLTELGCTHVKWKGDAVQFDPGSGRMTLGAEVLPSWLKSIEPPVDRLEVTLALADVTGLTPPRSLVSDFDAIRARLIPRVVTREAFSGPNRSMCRREVGTDLYATMWIAVGGRGLWLTTAELDQWPVDFDACFLLAKENMARVVNVGSLNEISDGHGVVAALAEGLDMAAVMLDLGSLLPECFASGANGALVSSPSAGTALLLPVVESNGAEGIASIVQIADMLLDPDTASEIQERLFWARPGGNGLLGYELEMLPVTVVIEDDVRRAHVDSSESVQALLRHLGEID